MVVSAFALDRLDNERSNRLRFAPFDNRCLNFGESGSFDGSVSGDVRGERVLEKGERGCWPIEGWDIELWDGRRSEGKNDDEGLGQAGAGSDTKPEYWVTYLVNGLAPRQGK